MLNYLVIGSRKTSMLFINISHGNDIFFKTVKVLYKVKPDLIGISWKISFNIKRKKLVWKLSSAIWRRT